MFEKTEIARLPTKYGEFQVIGYKDDRGDEFVVLMKGDLSQERLLVRIHSACLTGDTLHSKRCDCGNQLEESIQKIMAEGHGIIIYGTTQEGRGIGIINKIRAYHLQDNGRDTVDANLELGFGCDERHYKTAGDILKDLGVVSIRLLTNNPEKLKELDSSGINVEREPLEIPPEMENESYLRTKRERMGHMFSK